jgi:hypothetical protein
MSRVDLLNTTMDAAIAALSAGDYSTAVNKALTAQAILATLPKVSRSQGTGGGAQSAEWDAQAIDNFVRRLRQQQGASLGVQTAAVEIVEPTQYQDTGYNDGSSYGQVQ